MRLELIVLLALSWCVTSRDNDDDKGRPYEFGFTIDGQQHRHESKDVDGIIMGEFGFITADGVYHVTVFATDENGSYNILSMKNIKISEPLDQPGFEFPSRTPGSLMQPILAGLPAPVPTLPSTTTLRPQAPYDFTTVPSLNVASCSSCKIPSTTQRPPGAPNKLPFQTPAFQNPPKINGNQQVIIQNGHQPPNQLANNRPSFPSNNQFIHPPIGNLPLGNPPAGYQPIFPPYNQVTYTGNTVPSTNDRSPQQPSIETQLPFVNPGENIQPNRENPNIPSGNVPASPFKPRPPSKSPNYPISGGQPPFTPKDPTSLPKRPITVSNQQINIPGRDPIPIKDPYPNMVPGLPNGITENDMLDLLYKFNYTLGFHGHHEKGLKNGTKIGAYFVNGRDGISRVVEYVADENGYRPKVRFVNLGLDSPDTPKEGSEKKFGLKGFEFVWFPI